MTYADWVNIVLAILGIIISGGGLAIAIWQIIKMRTTSEAVHKEVRKSQRQIRQTLDSNEIGRAVKNLEQAIEFVSRSEYEHAFTRLMDVKSMIENEDVINTFLVPSNLPDFDYHKRCFNDSFKTIATDMKYPTNIDRWRVQNSLTNIHNYLLQIENKIKASVYERNS